MTTLLRSLGVLFLVTLLPSLVAALVLHAVLALVAPGTYPPYTVVLVWTWALVTVVAGAALLIQGPPPDPPRADPPSGGGAQGTPDRITITPAPPCPN